MFVIGVVAVACAIQFIYMVVRLANLSDFPAEQWGMVQITTNAQILISGLGLVSLYGIWNRSRWMIYGFYALAALNIVSSLYSGQTLIAAASGVAIVLILVAVRGKSQQFE